MQEKRRSAGYWCPFSDGTWTRYIHRSRGFRHRLGAATTPGRSPSYRVCSYIVRFWCMYKFFRARHPKWVGMRVNFKDLTIWSFLMASAHGAGLMLAPLLLRMPAAEASGHTHHAPASMTDNATMLLSAVGIHTLSFFVVTGLVAIIVYEVVGLALLRKAWFNLDLLWSSG